MRRGWRGELAADWLMLVGALALFVSLFLTWSHQLPKSVLDTFAGGPAIRGVPRDPTAWQVYTVADVVLALLAVGVVVVALGGRSRWSRVTALVAVAIGLAFTVHAANVAPTNGLLMIDPGNPSSYLAHTATPGAGETVAIIGLSLAALGLLISLAVDLSSKGVRSTR